MWPPGQGTVVSGRASTQPKQRKSPHEINRSVSGHRDTRAGPVAISQSAKLTGAHYASRQASHVARFIQVVHVTRFVQGVHVVDVTHGSYFDQLVSRLGLTRCIRGAHRKD